MEKIRQFGRETFSSLGIRNYRLYFIGQAVSLSGTWMQTIAQGLLVLKLTGSGTILGLVTALQFLPVLFLAPLGGLIADRYSKRKILFVTQSASGSLALILGTLVVTNTIQVWMIYILALSLGFVNAFDNPARQSFLMEMVGKDNLTNVVSLNSTEVNLARVIGPTLAGILVATVGLGACFIINGLSYIPVLVVLSLMNAKELQARPLVSKAHGQLMEGFRYVRSNLVLRNTLLMLAIVGMLTFEYQVILPLFAKFTFHGDATTYAELMASMGVGAVIGGLYTASKRNISMRLLCWTALLFGASDILVALAPNLMLAMAAMVIVGFFSISFASLGSVTLQMESAPEMRGRVMSLYSVAFLGTTPIGGPIIGAIGEHLNPRWGLIVGGLAAIFAAGLGARAYTESKRKKAEIVIDKTEEII